MGDAELRCIGTAVGAVGGRKSKDRQAYTQGKDVYLTALERRAVAWARAGYS